MFILLTRSRCPPSCSSTVASTYSCRSAERTCWRIQWVTNNTHTDRDEMRCSRWGCSAHSTHADCRAACLSSQSPSTCTLGWHCSSCNTSRPRPRPSGTEKFKGSGQTFFFLFSKILLVILIRFTCHFHSLLINFLPPFLFSHLLCSMLVVCCFAVRKAPKPCWLTAPFPRPTGPRVERIHSFIRIASRFVGHCRSSAGRTVWSRSYHTIGDASPTRRRSTHNRSCLPLSLIRDDDHSLTALSRPLITHFRQTLHARRVSLHHTRFLARHTCPRPRSGRHVG